MDEPTASEELGTELRGLKIEQVAEIVQLSPKTVMRAILSGDLEASQLTGGRGGWRVRERAIAAWYEARSNRSSGRRLTDLRARDTVAQPRRPGATRRQAADEGRLSARSAIVRESQRAGRTPRGESNLDFAARPAAAGSGASGFDGPTRQASGVPSRSSTPSRRHLTSLRICVWRSAAGCLRI
jgi:Helix-turn-helix domain